MFDLLLLIIGVILCLIGIVGSFFPIIPGPMTSWLGLLVINLTEAIPFKVEFLIITLIVAILISIFDYIIPILGVKKLGGSKGGLFGASIGLLLGLIIMGPLGLIFGPFIGAVSGEMINKKNFNDSLKPALGSLIGILIGSGIKFCLSLVYLFFYLETFWENRLDFF